MGTVVISGELHDALAAASKGLIGRALQLSDDDCRAPSRLPGWSRGHVLTHLARNADAIRGAIENAMAGQPAVMYPGGPAQRDADIAAGAERGALALIEDLDLACSRLWSTCDDLTPQVAASAVEGRPGLTIGDLPVARLYELVIHQVDLDVGFGIDDIPTHVVPVLLDWACRRRSAVPGVELHPSDAAGSFTIGSDPVVEITAPAADLLGWITERGPAIPGGEHVVLSE